MNKQLLDRKSALIESVLSIKDENSLTEIEKTVRIQIDLISGMNHEKDILGRRLTLAEHDIKRGNVITHEDLLSEIKQW